MNRTAFLFACVFAILPSLAMAVSDEQWGYADEISQRWVDEHNKAQKELVNKAVPLGEKESRELTTASKDLFGPKSKALNTETADTYGIPQTVVNAKGVTVSLMKLYRTGVNYVPGGEQVFLTADYYDELDPTHSVSDLYMKIGLKYFRFFHGEGYPHSIRLLFLDTTANESPLFFEVGQYGGGSRVDKVLYTLSKDQVNGLPQMLFDSPEKIDPKDLIQKKLAWSTWLNGETFYKDLAGDNNLEVVNISRAPYPEDLKARLAKKYNIANVDYTKSFRKTVTVYQWDDKKQSFVEVGDHYY